MHALTLAESPAADLAVLISPAAGWFRPLAHPAGIIAIGGMLGHVSAAGHSTVVTSPSDAVVDGVLVRSGDAVQRGQVLAWGRRCRLEALA